MPRSSSPRRSLVIASLVWALTQGCASEEEAATSSDVFDKSSCDTTFEARASRAGKERQARLSYGCAADVCGANDAFAAGTMQLVTIDVPTLVASSLEITSSDASVLRTMNVQASLDPCLGLTRAYVQLEAGAAGEASLRVTAEGVDDELMVRVLAPSSIGLRASPLHQFDLSLEGEITVEAGERLLVVPSLLSESGAPLRGLPALTWRVEDERFAAVRPDAKTEDERFLRDWAAPSAVFLDAMRSGRTQVIVTTASGTEGTLVVNIVEPSADPKPDANSSEATLAR